MGSSHYGFWPGSDVVAYLRSGIDAAAVLQLLPDEAEPPAANARDILAMCRPALDRQPKWILRRTKRESSKIKKRKRLAAQTHKFNASGKAVTQDDLMRVDCDVVAVGGSGRWKKWLPEAIQKAAFSRATLRQVALFMKDGHGPASTGKRGASSVGQTKFVCAKVIDDGTSKGLLRVRQGSVEKPLDFWINAAMFDETKLWYIVKGKGYRRFSTLAWHTQVTWKDDFGTHDEDVIRAPGAMRKYNASVQWNIMTDDPVAGILPKPGSRPLARYYGTLTIGDSHAVNKLTLKNLREEMLKPDVLMSSMCLQHPTGNTATAISQYLNVFTRTWTLAKTFGEGDFHQDLIEFAMEIFADEDEGLEVVDPDSFQLAPGDFGSDFTNAIMDRCYTCGLMAGESEDDDPTRFLEVKGRFIKFFPFGWNRGRPVHPCAAGCCGPTACHCRTTSVAKGFSGLGSH